MSLRRAGLLALPLALAACTEVTQQPLPTELAFASFASPNIPTPNDLALAGMVTRLPSVNGCATPVDLCAAPPNAQVALLCTFRAAGGFPSDQEVPISIPITAKRWDPAVGDHGAYVAQAAPAVDLATVNAGTVSVYRIDVNPPVAFVWGTELEAASTPGSCSGGSCTPGVLTIRKRPDATGSRRWPAGSRISFAIRGGASGVKAVGGLAIAADSAIELTIPNRDLTKKENQPLGGAIPDASAPGSCGAGSNGDEIALLENVRQILWNPLPWCYMPPGPATGAGGWNPVTSSAAAALCQRPPAPAYGSAYGVVSAFPYAETAAAAAFSVAPSAGTVVTVDSGSGVAPLPIDLLRTDADGTVINNPGFGPLAAGLDTLDGFSTTAMMLAQTSIPIAAGTVNGANVFLYRLTKETGGAVTAVTLQDELKLLAGSGGNPFLAKYVAQPTPIVIPVGGPLSATQTCPATATGGCSPVIGLQPAVGAPLSATTTVYLPPLAEATTYAVVVTSRVKDMLGNSLAKSTVAKILLDFPSTVALVAGGKSLIPGVSDATAAALSRMRDELAPVLAALPPGTTRADVITAYTFRTQTVTAGAVAVLPFGAAAAPLGATFYTPAQIGAAYGVDAAVTFPADPGLGRPTVAEFAEVPFNTNNLLLSGRTQGAFDPGQPTPEQVTALVAIPDPALVTGACPAGFTATKCAPLVVFRHGIPRAKGDMLPIASALAAKGFVVAAIDAEKHGDRTYCGAATQAAADQQCLSFTGGTSTCVHDPKLKTAADSDTVMGRCSGGLLRKRVDCALADPGCYASPATLAPKGIPAATGHYVFSLNLFRFRDTLRQDVIDQAALVNALAPAAPRAAGADAFAEHLALSDLAVNPNEVYFASLSLGSENATLSVAVNPRFKKGAFHAGFATIVDVSSNPASSDNATLLALLAAANPPILPGTPAYLQFLQVAKWVLDPGEAANYAPLLAPGAASAKPVLSQIGLCDARIPNAQSQYFTAMLGLPVPAPDAAGTGFTQWFINSASTASCPADRVDHGFLVSPTQSASLTAKAQVSFADFLATGAAQPTTVRP
jgi:hypothetical protein